MTATAEAPAPDSYSGATVRRVATNVDMRIHPPVVVTVDKVRHIVTDARVVLAHHPGSDEPDVETAYGWHVPLLSTSGRTIDPKGIPTYRPLPADIARPLIRTANDAARGKR